MYNAFQQRGEFKIMQQKYYQPQLQPQLESARLKRQSQSLRKEFLNSMVHNSSSSPNQNGPSEKEYSESSGHRRHSEESQSNEDQLSGSEDSSVVRNAARGKGKGKGIGAEIIGNSRNWNSLQLNFQEQDSDIQDNNQSSSKIKTQSNQQNLSSQLPKPQNNRQQKPKNTEQKSPQVQKSHYTSLQTLNYKKMLRDQLRKTQKVQQQLSKQIHKNNIMSQLVRKLKQQNALLVKLLKKEKLKNSQSLHSKTTTMKFKNAKKKYCECGDEKTPSTFLVNCTSSKMLK